MLRIQGAELYRALRTLKAHFQFTDTPSPTLCLVEHTSGVTELRGDDGPLSHRIALEGEGRLGLVEGRELQIPGKLLTKITSKLKKHALEVDVSGDELVLSAGSTTFRVGVVDSESDSSDSNDSNDSNVPAEAMARVLRVAPFASKLVDGLACVEIRVDDDGLRVTATDGHRLMSYPLDAPELATAIAQNGSPVLLSRGHIAYGARFLDVSPDAPPITAAVSDAFVTFAQGPHVLRMLRELVCYPKVSGLLERVAGFRCVHVSKSDMLRTLDKASTCMGKDARVDLEIYPTFTVVRTKNASGMFEETVTSSSDVPNAGVKVTLNLNYLTEFLVLGGEDVRVHVLDPTTPVYIEADDDPERTALVMPMLR